MTSEQIIAAAMAKREKLQFIVPGRKDVYTCYPRNNAEKNEWLRKAENNVWKLQK